MSTVCIDKLTKRYDAQDEPALRSLSLDIAEGEFLVLVGPSGCGKSTALKLIAGLEDVSDGTVSIGETVVNDYASRDRDIAMVFQNYALYPHMTVYENIAFPMSIARRPRAEIDAAVKDVARTLQLEALLGRKPAHLSGGQRQRVAMGRALIRRPSVFLMDEPLSNLDAKLRVQMRSEIAQIQRRLKVTTIYVTHDQVEAMTMGDRVALMRKGVLQQVDTPDTLYHRPANTFVASFIGSPAMNLFRAQLTQSEDAQMMVTFGDQTLAVTDRARDRHPGLRTLTGDAVIVGIRPEDIEDAGLVGDAAPSWKIRAEVKLVESLGSDHMTHLRIDAEQVFDTDDDTGDVAPDKSVCIARFGARSTVRAGQTATAVVQCDWLHFFDPKTGEALSKTAQPPGKDP
ncbi:ABC transporter ATP-binding protein [Ruegeria jejuensis]|uniref:ABC transporter ATP-binding protein n=1 Tax=Ruegeria jejuensis TaxID=3233338 RepID=UPI00355AFEFC